MQVRVTPPRKKAAVLEEGRKKKATKNRSECPSTYVSSPIRALSKRNIKSYTYDQDDVDDHQRAAAQSTRGKDRIRYDTDFVIPDDGDDDYSDFAPVRDAKPLKRTKSKKPSAPITVDERLTGLDDLQQDILADYMTGAKDMIRDIKLKKGVRYAPFADTILREMGLDLPSNTEEMLAIPGINPEMVRLYGKKFLPLIRNTRDMFASAKRLPVPRHLLRRGAAEEEYGSDEDDDERPADPNHRIEIDLCDESDGEGAVQAQAENESEVSMGDFEEDDDDDELVHTSHHFSQSIDPDVEAFNRRFSQGGAPRANARPKAPSTTRPATPRAGSAKPSFRKKNYRKRSSGNFGDSYGGVKKRGASKAPNARRSGGTSRKAPSGGVGNRRSGGGSGARGGGGGGWSGIMAMPTG